MDDHSDYDEDEYFPVICYDVRDHGGVPPGAYLIYHVLGCIPCLHVCSLWIEVAAAPEEQTGEGDEYECLDDTPYISQSLPSLSVAEMVNISYCSRSEDHQHPYCKHIPDRKRVEVTDCAESSSDDCDVEHLEMPAGVLP